MKYSSRDRYLRTLNGEATDHLPRTPILMQFAAEYIGSNYGAFASDFNVLSASNIACAKEFNMDQVSTISDPYRETQGYGAEVIFEPNVVPYVTKHPLEDDEDLSLLKEPDPYSSERMLDRVNAVRSYKEKLGEEYSILGWVEGPAAEAADLRKLDNFFMDLLDDEEFIGDLMDKCVEVALKFAKAQIEQGADTIGIGDAAASQVSADTYEELILPRQHKLVRGIHEMGGKARMHICGNISHLLPGLSSLGLNTIDVDHMVGLSEVRQQLGKSVAIGANLDPVSDLYRSTPEKIRERLETAYQEAGNPFIVNAGCEIPSGTPFENLKALCEPIAYKA